ncbi:MAG: redoxin domain-containing protein [Acidimicrobiia bacterium]|nr:redoxin domain-containing protein [Acidimicrobiia bacterium]MDH4306625.1 redoxin domain-containing protein [Acidimicrobiia bacterium]MDH5292065.1 redoxin domain-containing protein [Acidimicrobiia bacterium]
MAPIGRHVPRRAAGQDRRRAPLTFGRIHCRNTVPHLRELRARHAENDLAIVGIHAPEFENESDPTEIAAVAELLGVTWPIALDTERSSFRLWQGSPASWPRTYVLDRDGGIRFDR